MSHFPRNFCPCPGVDRVFKSFETNLTFAPEDFPVSRQSHFPNSPFSPNLKTEVSRVSRYTETCRMFEVPIFRREDPSYQILSKRSCHLLRYFIFLSTPRVSPKFLSLYQNQYSTLPVLVPMSTRVRNSN